MTSMLCVNTLKSAPFIECVHFFSNSTDHFAIREREHHLHTRWTWALLTRQSSSHFGQPTALPHSTSILCLYVCEEAFRDSTENLSVEFSQKWRNKSELVRFLGLKFKSVKSECELVYFNLCELNFQLALHDIQYFLTYKFLCCQQKKHPWIILLYIS